MGKPGLGYMISVPGSPNMRIAKNIVTLPPGTTTILAGSTSTPRRAAMSAATASRRAGMPGAGV